MSLRPQLSSDTRQVSTGELVAAPHASSPGLRDILSLLASPDSGKPLALVNGGAALSDGEHFYPQLGETQLLLPHRLQPHFTDRLKLPLIDYADDAFMQYFLLASIKQSGEINAPADDVHYERHLHRLRDLLAGAEGLLLDVGCDDPEVGASLLPPSARYVGLDPFCSREAPFRVIGVGEYLPVRHASLDGILFNTSLDHILDWRRALEEACRVLVPGGRLYLCTLVWTERAGLVTDSVHFHHFREYEIFGALEGLDIEDVRRYDYKGNDHRHGLYLTVRKPA